MPTPFLPLVMAEEFHQSSTQIGLVPWQQVSLKRRKKNEYECIKSRKKDDEQIMKDVVNAGKRVGL